MPLEKTDLEHLERLLDKTEAFIGDIFDWVWPLRETRQLPNLYAFRASIEEAITELKTRPEEATDDE